MVFVCTVEVPLADLVVEVDDVLAGLRWEDGVFVSSLF